MLAKRNTDTQMLFASRAEVLSRARKAAWDRPFEEAPAAWVFRAVGRHISLVVLMVVISIALTLEALQFVTPVYTTTAKIYVQPQIGSSNGADMPRQRDLLTSTPVLATALTNGGVRDLALIRGRRDALNYVQHALEVDIDADNRLVQISFDSQSPSDGTTLVGAVVNSYLQFESGMRRNSNADVIDALRLEKKNREDELARKSADLLHFAEANHIRIEHGNSLSLDDTVQRLGDSLSDAHFDALKAQTDADDLDRAIASDSDRAKRMKDFEATPAGQKASGEEPEMLRRERVLLKAREIDLEQKFMPGHPALISLQHKIAELEASIDVAVMGKLTRARQREADLQRIYDQEQNRAVVQSANQAEYAHRSDAIAALKSSIDTLNIRLRTLDGSDSIAAPALTLLEPAKASDSPTSPNIVRFTLFAAAAGLVVGLVMACFSEILPARRVVNTNDRGGAGVPVLGEIPILPTNFGPLGDGHRILTADGPAADALHRLHIIVQTAGIGGRGTTVLVTSPARGDGKSTLASNLAVSLALTRKRVVLVDADFRNRAQARMFGIADATGLGTLLDSPSPIMITAIHHTATPSLDVVPCGPVTRSPSEMLNSQLFADVLGDLAERYDYVIIDSPAAVTFSDARTIAASCDLTLMVIRAGTANRRLFELAREGLTNVGANLVGIILNKAIEVPAGQLPDGAISNRAFRSSSPSAGALQTRT